MALQEEQGHDSHTRRETWYWYSLASRVPTTESLGNLLEIKGEERVFKGGSYTLEELTLMIEKFVGNSLPARSLSEMRELHRAWMGRCCQRHHRREHGRRQIISPIGNSETVQNVQISLP